MIRALACTLALASLAGCAFVPFRHPHRHVRSDRPAAAPVAATGGTTDIVAPCRAEQLKVLEGRPGSAVLAAQALDLSGARSIRWMHPGEVVTMDFRPDRLNIKLTRHNIVKSFVCG